MKKPSAFGDLNTDAATTSTQFITDGKNFVQVDEESRQVLIPLSIYKSLITTLESQARTIETLIKELC